MIRNKKCFGLKYVMFAGFGIFTLFFVLILWFVQTVYIEDIYKSIRVSAAKRTAYIIAENISNANLQELTDTLSSSETLCIQVMDSAAKVEADSDRLMTCIIHHIDIQDKLDLANQARQNEGELLVYLERGEFISGSEEKPHPKPDNRENVIPDTAIFCLITKDESLTQSEKIIFVNVNIIPLIATISTIRTELIWVTGIMILAAALMAAIISRKIAEPIAGLNKSAKALGRGEYSVRFDEKGYLEVMELAKTLNAAASELSKVEEYRRELMANISHDMRTPLTMISGYSEIMRDIKEENNPQNLQVIIDEAERLKTLVNDILELSKLENDKSPFYPEVFDFRELIRQIVERFEKMTSPLGYSFKFTCGPQRLMVKAEAGGISQVIYNLLSNAVNYSGENKNIEIEVFVEKGTAITRITDHGYGISQGELPYIWQRYYKDEHHKRPVAGTGLGLSVVKSVLVRHGARYGVESKENQGSCFWFALELWEEK